VLEMVGPSLVEMVRVLESHVLPTRRDWDKASGLDVKGFGVRRPVLALIKHQFHPPTCQVNA
jgi:hypothetical protein